MTKIQYLKSRIFDLEQSLNDKNTPQKLKRIQKRALLNYQLDLERIESGAE